MYARLFLGRWGRSGRTLGVSGSISLVTLHFFRGVNGVNGVNTFSGVTRRRKLCEAIKKNSNMWKHIIYSTNTTLTTIYIVFTSLEQIKLFALSSVYVTRLSSLLSSSPMTITPPSSGQYGRVWDILRDILVTAKCVRIIRLS